MRKKIKRRSPSEIKKKNNVTRRTVLGDCMDGWAASPNIKSKLSSLINAQSAMHIEVSQCACRAPVGHEAGTSVRGDAGARGGSVIPRSPVRVRERHWRDETNPDLLEKEVQRLKREVDLAIYERRDDDAEAAHDELIDVEHRHRQATRRRT